MTGALLTFDRTAIEAHVSLLHDLAEGLDGILILAAFEEGGLPNVQRFGIGDVAGMVDVIMGFEGHPRANLYIPWAVMRRDLEPRKKGTEEDVIAVLAAVSDLDNDKHQDRQVADGGALRRRKQSRQFSTCLYFRSAPCRPGRQNRS